MKEYVPNWAAKHNDPRLLKHDKIKPQTTEQGMWLLCMLQVSNKDVTSLLNNNFLVSLLLTLNGLKVSVNNKSWQTNKVLSLHKTLIVIAVQIVILYSFLLKAFLLWQSLWKKPQRRNPQNTCRQRLCKNFEKQL